MERLSLKKIIAPAVALALGLAACGGDSKTVEEQLKAPAADVQEHCDETAEAAFVAEFEDVENDPTTPQDEVYEANKRKQEDGQAFLEGAFNECVVTEWTTKVEAIDFVVPSVEQFGITPTTAVTETTVEG